MTTFREKLGPRIHALREIGKDLIELAWLFFAAAQWFVAIAAPLYLIITVFCLLSGRPMPAAIHDTTLLSFRGYFYSTILLLSLTTFAYYYLLKMRKNGEPPFAHKCSIMALYLAVLLMLSYKVELCEYRYIANNVQYSETTVRLFDADTKRPLRQVSYIGPPSGQHSVWPTKYGTMFSPDGSYTIWLIDIQPMEVGFSSPGYETKKVKIGEQEGEEAISVFLEKKPAEGLEATPAPKEEKIVNDPNAPSR